MAQSNVYPDFTKFFSEMKLPAVDFNGFFSMQRRNIEALSAANQAMSEGVRAISRRNAEILQSNIEELLKTAKELWTSEKPEQNASKQAEFAKYVYESALASVRELTEMASKSNGEALEVLNKRFVESMDELTKVSGVNKKN